MVKYFVSFVVVVSDRNNFGNTILELEKEPTSGAALTTMKDNVIEDLINYTEIKGPDVTSVTILSFQKLNGE